MKKYVIVGLGSRSEFFTVAISTEFKANCKLLAICDNNPGRLDLAKKKLTTYWPNLSTYSGEDFDLMLREQKPDYVIVTTRDCSHDDFICRALQAGSDVITEKPMTTDADKCQRIIDTVKQTGKNVRVTFNCRYSPPRGQVKELLDNGTIGKVLSVEFKWMLDTNHGADYFRRWHRNKKNSGGLLVHKATHHFDLVNWWLNSVPQSVSAMAERVFYNEAQARRYGLQDHGPRCLDCPVSDRCNYFLDMSNFDSLKELYLDQEHHDHYYRDQCVFSDEIDIEDSMNLIVRYRQGTLMSYSLNAFSPWEGYHVAFNGTKGRLEHLCQESSYISGDGSIQGALDSQATSITIHPHFETPYSVQVQKGEGSHGGGDTLLAKDIFEPSDFDPLGRRAGYVQGAYSILIGIAANKSISSGCIVSLDDLVKDLPLDGFPDSISGDEQIEYVKDACRIIDEETG